MSRIALNFFPLTTDQFTIDLYCLPFVQGKRPRTRNEEAVRRSLKIDGHYDYYWTLFQRTKGSTKVVYQPFDDIYVTLDVLRLALIQSCKNNLNSREFQIIKGFRQHVEIVTQGYCEGYQVVSLEPYLLHSRHQFGFLADFRFHPNEKHRGTQRSLQLSLSLDKHGQSNLNYYADRYSQLIAYTNKFHKRIFPLETSSGQKVTVETQLVTLISKTLEVKRYVVGSDTKSRSQFMGIKRAGPFKQISDDMRLYFVYRNEDHRLAQDLFRALRGDTFRTFSGMNDIFRLPISNNNVRGIDNLTDFNASEIQQIRSRVIADAAGRQAVPIVLSPFSRHDAPEDNAAYWHLKHAFLLQGLPIQVVATETIKDKDKLKWAASGIGLQIFAKLGGTPWKVYPCKRNCLIIGIGQAHQVSEKYIDRFFAYSVLTDSSGIFEEVRVLGDSQNEDNYIENFSAGLRNIFIDYSSRFSSFVIHTTFTIKRRELESIDAVLSEQQTQFEKNELVALKFNDRRNFFGFATTHNSRVPYESAVIRLSRNEFLVWFEGLQYNQPTVSKKIGRPLHVKFTYPRDAIPQEQQRVYLQDAINLSGANWRGFNAKSLPVSVYYAQLIAKYLKEFEFHGLPMVNVEILTPWFL